MRFHTVVLCGLLLVGVGGGVAVGGVAAMPASDEAVSNATGPAGAAAQVTTTTPAEPTTSDDGTATENGSDDRPDRTGPGLGAELSAFVSSTGAATEGTVEREMSSASLNRSADPRAVEARVTTLATRYERLRADRRALERARENGSVTLIEYRARRAALAARAESLGDSVAAVTPTARRHGVANESLKALQRRLPTERTTRANPTGNAGPSNGSLPPLGPSNDTPAVGPPTASATPESPATGTGAADRSNDNGGSPDPPGSDGSGGANGAPSANESEPGGEGAPGHGNASKNTSNTPARETPANGSSGAERGDGRTGVGPDWFAGNGSSVAVGPLTQRFSFAPSWAVALLG